MTIYARLLRIDREQLVLRITEGPAIVGDFPITVSNAAFLCAEAALFVRDRFQSLPSNQSNQTQQEQSNGA